MIARVWTLDAIPNDRLGVKNDNWVVGENGKLIKWVPKNLRTHPCGHRYISMPNHSFYFRLRYVTVWNGISCCLMFDLYLASPASYFGRVYWNATLASRVFSISLTLLNSEEKRFHDGSQ